MVLSASHSQALACLALCLAAAGCGAPGASVPPEPVEHSELGESPGAVRAAAAGWYVEQVSDKLLPPGILVPRSMDITPLSPHVAVGLSGEVAVAYAVENQIWVSVSPDGGERFAAPVRVGGRGLLGKGPGRGPKIAVNDRAMVVVGVCGDELMGQDGDLLAWRSTDKGASWSGPVVVNDVDDAAREGLAAIAAAKDGRLLCVWLDLREGSTELWGAWSLDGGASWSENSSLYASPGGTICQCCHPTVSFDPRTGEALIMWRNALDGNRDMYLARITDGVVGTARRLGNKSWRLAGCPQAGGGLAVSVGGDVFTGFRRRQDLFRATPGGFEKPLGRGEHVRVGVGPKGASYLWRQGRTLRALVAGDEVSLGQGNHPWIASAPDGKGPVVAVWESEAEGPGRLHYRVLQGR